MWFLFFSLSWPLKSWKNFLSDYYRQIYYFDWLWDMHLYQDRYLIITGENDLTDSKFCLRFSTPLWLTWLQLVTDNANCIYLWDLPLQREINVVKFREGSPAFTEIFKCLITYIFTSLKKERLFQSR